MMINVANQVIWADRVFLLDFITVGDPEVRTFYQMMDPESDTPTNTTSSTVFNMGTSFGIHKYVRIPPFKIEECACSYWVTWSLIPFLHQGKPVFTMSTAKTTDLTDENLKLDVDGTPDYETLAKQLLLEPKIKPQRPIKPEIENTSGPDLIRLDQTDNNKGRGRFGNLKDPVDKRPPFVRKIIRLKMR